MRISLQNACAMQNNWTLLNEFFYHRSCQPCVALMSINFKCLLILVKILFYLVAPVTQSFLSSVHCSRHTFHNINNCAFVEFCDQSVTQSNAFSVSNSQVLWFSCAFDIRVNYLKSSWSELFGCLPTKKKCFFVDMKCNPCIVWRQHLHSFFEIFK